MGALLAVVVMMAGGLVRLGEAAGQRAEAQAAADMAALAGAVEGREGAADLARRNGGELVGFGEGAGGVWVVVQVGEAEARAWARFEWTGTS